MLTLLIIAIAGLGVLNTVALQVREKAHDIGIFKALGMTPRQTLSMVVCSVGITGLVAGIVAVPVGILLHHNVLPAMASAANSGIPQSVMSVYSVPEMVLLGLAGLVIAIAGALARPHGRPAPGPPPPCGRSKALANRQARSRGGGRGECGPSTRRRIPAR
jgi:putative ABC transport system permease protein